MLCLDKPPGDPAARPIFNGNNQPKPCYASIADVLLSQAPTGAGHNG